MSSPGPPSAARLAAWTRTRFMWTKPCHQVPWEDHHRCFRIKQATTHHHSRPNPESKGAETLDFFFCCIAERAIKPCRSSRSKLRGEFGIPRHSQNWKQKHTKATKPNKNTKQTKDKSRQVLECETRGEKRVKRPKRPNALICRTPGRSMRYP